MVKSADDVERALRNKGLTWDSRDGHNSHELKDGSGRIMWDDNQTFSEPMQHYMTGVLKVFGILGLLAAVAYFFM